MSNWEVGDWFWDAQELMKTDPQGAVRCLEQAMSVGRKHAVFWLAFAIENQDRDRALELYADAIREGETEAYYRAGRLLEQKGDIAAAQAHYEQGTDRGDPAAMLGMYAVTPWGKPLRKLKWMVRSAPGVIRRHYQAQFNRVEQLPESPPS